MSLSTTSSLSRHGKGHRRSFRWPRLLSDDGRGLAYGGDYNPDQWPEDVWDEDVQLMVKAGVNVVAVGIFSWARIQPSPDVYDFGWLDRVVGKLGAAGIAVDLASATATAPLWLYERHPEVLPRQSDGTVVNPGARQSWRPTSPVFRSYALDLCRRMSEHYRDNPYVVAWHVGNEYGWNNREDYSSDAVKAFRMWCRREYGSIRELNDAWGTAFWSQEVIDFDQILPPLHMGNDAMANPAQKLDYDRFCSESLKDFYMAERDALAAITPDRPLTTNFMVSTDQCAMDYADWSDEVDFVSNDHYFTPGELHLDELLCSDSLVDGFALRRPWYVMEHSTSAVQWKALNARKTHGELTRDALAHLSMGADAICFFQWRQSRSGAEAFHSAMLPHAGSDSTVFREICGLGDMLKTLAREGLQGTVLRESSVALLFDADSEWATWSRTLPSGELSHWHEVRDWYRACLDAGAGVDVVPMRADWSGYDTVILPSVLLCSDKDVGRIEEFAHSGGTVVVGYASGLADERFRVGLGGYPGMLRSLLGVRGEEFNIIGSIDGHDEKMALSDGSLSGLWQTRITSVDRGCRILATYEGTVAEDWDMAGTPAIVRREVERGVAYYVGCDLRIGDMAAFLRREGIVPDAEPIETGAETLDTTDGRIAHMVREGGGRRFDFYLNRTRDDVVLARVVGRAIVEWKAIPNDAGNWYTLSRSGVVVTTSLID
jgi:beta-galactosidase